MDLYIFITMGRVKKYNTVEEKLDAKRKRAKEYYWTNKEKCDEQAKKRYHKKKKM